MNETPTFMHLLISSLRHGGNGYSSNKAKHRIGSLRAIVWETQRRCGNDAKAERPNAVLDRPKTPSTQDFLRYNDCGVWLARYFRPVFLAFVDGMSDADLIKLWIKTDKKDCGYDKQASKDRQTEMTVRKSTITIRARDLTKAHDWNTVK